MKNKTSPDSNITSTTPYSSVSQAVAALTESELNQLVTVAESQLELVGKSPVASQFTVHHQARDFVQETIKLVLLGEVSPGQGCQVPVRHLAGPQTFFDFLQDVLHRLIRTRWIRFTHGEMDLADI